jgi:hypothetical protein
MYGAKSEATGPPNPRGRLSLGAQGRRWCSVNKQTRGPGHQAKQLIRVEVPYELYEAVRAKALRRGEPVTVIIRELLTGYVADDESDGA